VKIVPDIQVGGDSGGIIGGLGAMLMRNLAEKNDGVDLGNGGGNGGGTPVGEVGSGAASVPSGTTSTDEPEDPPDWAVLRDEPPST
jgi:hypothetical protein